jgi:hypothetical protein
LLNAPEIPPLLSFCIALWPDCIHRGDNSTAEAAASGFVNGQSARFPVKLAATQVFEFGA